MQDETSEQAPDLNRWSRARAVPDVIAFAARRSHTLDEHNLVVDDARGRRRGTLRLQLFEAAGKRPVAIATQLFTAEISDGQSLTNGAEAYASAVWQQYFPADPQPPVWVELQLFGGDQHARGEGFQAVAFTLDADRPYRLRSPEWQPLEPQEVAALVGGEVDATRGDEFIPPEREPQPQPYFRVMSVLALPPTAPFREPGCMPADRSQRLGRRLLRQLYPQRAARSCSWYHGGDWQKVNSAAIELVRAAEGEQVDGADLWAWASERLDRYGLSAWETEALLTLFSTVDGIQPSVDGDDYVNGQHRAQAMLDQGVRSTVVCYWRWPEESSPADDGERRDDRGEPRRAD